LDQFGSPYTTIEVGGGDGGDGGYDHIETTKLDSRSFRNWLCRAFYSNSQGAKILTSDNVTNVLSVLKARAEFDSGDRRELHLRVASITQDPSTIYNDLTNKHWEYVKITPDCWRIIKSSKITPTTFKRVKNQKLQVYPAKSGDYPPDIFDRWLGLVNIKKANDETNLEEIQKEQDAKILLKC
jgi:hypothetical protein